jgi:hypothetical protein
MALHCDRIRLGTTPQNPAMRPPGPLALAVQTSMPPQHSYGYTRVWGSKRANTSFTSVGSYADSRTVNQFISWQLSCGFENMEPSSENA